MRSTSFDVEWQKLDDNALFYRNSQVFVFMNVQSKREKIYLWTEKITKQWKNLKLQRNVHKWIWISRLVSLVKFPTFFRLPLWWIICIRWVPFGRIIWRRFAKSGDSDAVTVFSRFALKHNWSEMRDSCNFTVMTAPSPLT